MVVRRIPVHTQSILTWYSALMQDFMSHRILSTSFLVLYILGTVCTGDTVIIGLPTASYFGRDCRNFNILVRGGGVSMHF